MSTIEAMGIQGIRSFGPDSSDFMKVKFFKPLTLILGANGTGKTTIIECLKYATTSDMPPGCKGAGAAFVHDPKLTNEREVKGQVKLMIKDVTGAALTVERSVIARVKDGKGKKTEMKTLDGVLVRETREGVKESITSRCADLNREMIGALGVSKAVLENVIFCHQEDSNWPLSEGKALKDKFDAIFASTRYTKVMEEIKKLKVSQDQEIREGKKELEYLKQHKDKAQQLTGDLEQLETQLAASVDSVQHIKDKLAPIGTRLAELNNRAHDIGELQREKYKYESEKEQIENTIQELSAKIEEEFTGTTEELRRQLKQFSTQVQAKNRELQECNRKQDELTSELARFEKETNKLMVESGKLQQEAETNSEKIEERDAKVREMAEEYNFTGFEGAGEISDSKYGQFFKELKEKLQIMMDEARKKKEEYEEEEKKLQEKVDSLRESKAKLENSEKMKRDNMDKNKVEIREIKQKLANMMSSEGRLTNLKTDLKRAENDLQSTEAAVNVEELRGEIASLDKKKKALDGEIGELNTEMNQLHKQSGAQAQLEMFGADLQEKEATIGRLRATHEESITSLLGDMPGDEFLRESVDAYISSQNDTVQRCEATLRDVRTSLSTKEAERKNTKAQLDEKEEELRGQEAKIDRVCEGQDLDEALKEVQEKLNQEQEDKGSMLGVEHMYKKYIRALEKTKPDCPLCRRGFQREQEARELILKLQNDMRRVPANMRRVEESLGRLQQRYDQLTQLKAVRETATALKDRDIPGLKVTLKKVEGEVRGLKEEKQAKEDALMSLQVDLDIAKGLHSDVVSMDRYRGEVRELQRKVETQRALLPAGGATRSVHDVIALQEEKQLELDGVNRGLDHKRDKLSGHQDRLLRLRTRVHDLTGEKLTIEGELQQKTKLEERKVTLTSDNATYLRDIEEAKAQLKPIETQIGKIAAEKDKLTQQKEKMMEEARADVDVVKNKGLAIRELNGQVKTYQQSNKAQHLTECKEKQNKLRSSQERKEEERKDLEARVNQLREEVTRQDIKKRSLEDTMTLHKKQEDLRGVEEKMGEVRQKLGDLDIKNLQRERTNLMDEEDKMREDLHRATGRQQGFKDQIKATKKELNSDICKDADKKYRDMVIQNRTLEIANGDLQKYYKAMDLAIMRYHHTKMEEINVIVRELWKNTYMGNDIETIEVRSEDDDAATSGSATIKTRRNYNYRVVMIKNGIPIDMRGRCSAGQKVLASLIIRLALAETFCVNCGILALDEPTTNLDRSNIESLAFALVRIIQERSSQRHFQLVVITHDEDFVELLGRTEYVDHFVQVSKNVEGLSRLSVKQVQELHSR
ncbi:DNA repair protein RAD50 [Aplysia californica]|uniref:DNA repair protein RAD50 n=1 Tax=Aplysia californica TaxID=6500 RepID=A0ABM0JW44_APLCA|nr:DNA repair protein RAD50 [Aplysia californica]XP_005102892.1 DNA repair protein RAD50 [Aplysia californica]XP_005102893.1 DNA repair protein RAD50 [Aplysia californica]XP_012940558.1 DNA repair protein RAD50 [Aplysia californica]